MTFPTILNIYYIESLKVTFCAYPGEPSQSIDKNTSIVSCLSPLQGNTYLTFANAGVLCLTSSSNTPNIKKEQINSN